MVILMQKVIGTLKIPKDVKKFVNNVMLGTIWTKATNANFYQQIAQLPMQMENAQLVSTGLHSFKVNAS
jgi:hypothetical protein